MIYRNMLEQLTAGVILILLVDSSGVALHNSQFSIIPINLTLALSATPQFILCLKWGCHNITVSLQHIACSKNIHDNDVATSIDFFFKRSALCNLSSSWL